MFAWTFYLMKESVSNAYSQWLTGLPLHFLLKLSQRITHARFSWSLSWLCMQMESKCIQQWILLLLRCGPGPCSWMLDLDWGLFLIKIESKKISLEPPPDPHTHSFLNVVISTQFCSAGYMPVCCYFRSTLRSWSQAVHLNTVSVVSKKNKFR